MLPETYIESDVQYEVPYTKKIDFETDIEYEEQTEEALIEELREKATKYIEENKYPKVSYTTISNINDNMDIGDTIQVLHPLVSIKTEVLEYEYDVVFKKIKSLTFGNFSRDVKAKFNSIKESINKIGQTLSKQETVIQNQTSLINMLNKTGYVYIDENEILILDMLPKESAKNIWRFGLGGIGFSSNGYEGPFETAITMDGQINAKFVTTGTMSVSRIEGLVDELEGIRSSIQLSMDGVTTEIRDTTKELEEKINTIRETVEGTQQTLSHKGGNNIFYYAKEFWSDGTDNGIANLEEYTDTEIQQKSISGNGYIINKGTSEQKQAVKNDSYTISFTYKKLLDLAEGYVEINGTRYDLTSTEWQEQIITEKIDTNTIDFKIVSDTDNAFVIFDLMGSIGEEKQVWTQNPNETRTDTVTIGKGIEVNSSSKNTYARFDADGNRIFNKATGEVVTELTDKGVDTDKVTADVGQVGGILIQEIDGQTWISSLI